MPGMNMTGGTAAAANRSNAQRASAGVTQPLTQAEIAHQNQLAEDMLHEKALQPKILPDGTKVFTLTASAFPWYMWLGETVEAWGYNGQTPGPLIRVRVGDKVEIVVHNHLPDATTIHWHGLAVPNAMDGVPGVTQVPIPPGGTYVYKFTVTPQMVGTHYYHSHYNDLFQVDHGLYGPLIVDPATPSTHYDVDALYVLGGWNIAGGEDNEDGFTMDGKPYPNAPQLNVKLGQTVRIRLINASGMSEHAMHLHGYTFRVIAIDGNPVAHPQAQNTLTLLPGETADIAFTANNPGRWMFHCHILDHTMNPGDEVDDMGGLVTFINVKK
ncbi:MAG: multicopper oxidase domain-containing protein [Alicyclobacillaceae bacterium]|nr:multicopper oxidase domain-containing protein [Alicyclobacillaceae bacterium]